MDEEQRPARVPWIELSLPVVLGALLVPVLVEDGGGSFALPGLVYTVGWFAHGVLIWRGRRRAATAVLTASLVAVLVVALVSREWLFVVGASLGLVVVAALSLWGRASRLADERA